MDNKQLSIEAKFFKSLGDPSRLAILEVISENPLTVSEIVELTGLSQPNTSMHLACLLDCGLVQNNKEGRNSIYQLSGEEVKAVIETARSIISQHSKQLFECTRY